MKVVVVVRRAWVHADGGCCHVRVMAGERLSMISRALRRSLPSARATACSLVSRTAQWIRVSQSVS